MLVVKSRNDDVALELGLTNLTLDLTAIHGEVTKVSEQLLGTVLTVVSMIKQPYLHRRRVLDYFHR